MKQTWRDLLFAHWPVAAEALQALIPAPLRLDVYEGQAWVGVVPFSMSGIRLRAMPPIPFASAFAEMNVRTYVTIDDKPGVYFFSLDAAHFPAVHAARLFYHLPYHFADIRIAKDDRNVRYRCERRGSNGRARFDAVYRPVSPPFQARRGTLEHWLTERYCLYTCYRGRAYRCDILHHPWPLQHAEGEIDCNTMAAVSGITLPGQQPLLHFSERLDVLTWGLEKA